MLAIQSLRLPRSSEAWFGIAVPDPEFLISISSGELNVLTAVALNFENLVAKVLPITISSAAMVKEKGRLIGIGIFEPDEHFSTLDNPAALCALLYFRHCFLTYRRLEQAFAMLMGDTLASRDRRILVLRLELVTRAVDRMKVPGTGRLCFQFFAQPQNVVIDSPCRRIVLVSPHFTE
jgi:hypothetical protein